MRSYTCGRGFYLNPRGQTSETCVCRSVWRKQMVNKTDDNVNIVCCAKIHFRCQSDRISSQRNQNGVENNNRLKTENMKAASHRTSIKLHASHSSTSLLLLIVLFRFFHLLPRSCLSLFRRFLISLHCVCVSLCFYQFLCLCLSLTLRTYS